MVSSFLIHRNMSGSNTAGGSAAGALDISVPHPFALSNEQMGIPRYVNIWKTSAIKSFRELLVLVHSELPDGSHLSSIYSCIFAVSKMPETTTFVEARDIISEEIPMQRIFREATGPSGKSQFFRHARRTHFLFGGPNPNTVRGHSLTILAQILYRDAVISELDWFVLKNCDWLSSLFKVETLVLGGKHNSRAQVGDVLLPDGGQAAASVNDGGSANRNGTDSVYAGSPSNENAIGATSITGDRLEMVNDVARLGQFSLDQMNAAISMRNRRLGISESTIVAQGGTNLHDGNANVSGIGPTCEMRLAIRHSR
jgi:hypothetical protein